MQDYCQRMEVVYQDFFDQKEEQILLSQKRLTEKMNELNNNNSDKVKIYNQSIGDIFLQMKDSTFETLDDLLQGRFESETLTKNNRIFYIGIFILFFTVLLQLIQMINTDNSPQIQQSNKHVIELQINKLS